jgi:hypothetical protein
MPFNIFALLAAILLQTTLSSISSISPTMPISPIPTHTPPPTLFSLLTSWAAQANPFHELDDELDTPASHQFTPQVDLPIKQMPKGANQDKIILWHTSSSARNEFGFSATYIVPSLMLKWLQTCTLPPGQHEVYGSVPHPSSYTQKHKYFRFYFTTWRLITQPECTLAEFAKIWSDRLPILDYQFAASFHPYSCVYRIPGGSVDRLICGTPLEHSLDMACRACKNNSMSLLRWGSIAIPLFVGLLALF